MSIGISPGRRALSHCRNCRRRLGGNGRIGASAALAMVAIALIGAKRSEPEEIV
jgi:hypothetical protein